MKRIKEIFSRVELVKFIFVGLGAVALDAGIYLILKQKTDIFAAKAISYISGATLGFVLNKYWTFQSEKLKFIEICKYVILYVFSAVVNTLLNRSVLYFTHSIALAFLCATGTSTVINFLGQKFLVFKNE